MGDWRNGIRAGLRNQFFSVQVRGRPPQFLCVAQSGRALRLGRRGQRFKSSHADQVYPSSSMAEQGPPKPKAEGSSPSSDAKFARRLMVKAPDCGSGYGGSIPLGQPTFGESPSGKAAGFGLAIGGSNPSSPSSWVATMSLVLGQRTAIEHLILCGNAKKTSLKIKKCLLPLNNLQFTTYQRPRFKRT